MLLIGFAVSGCVHDIMCKHELPEENGRFFHVQNQQCCSFACKLFISFHKAYTEKARTVRFSLYKRGSNRKMFQFSFFCSQKSATYQIKMLLVIQAQNLCKFTKDACLWHEINVAIRATLKFSVCRKASSWDRKKTALKTLGDSFLTSCVVVYGLQYMLCFYGPL